MTGFRTRKAEGSVEDDRCCRAPVPVAAHCLQTGDANRAGGHINVRSYSGAVSWTAGVGDVRPVGSTSGVPSGQQGTISLTYCTTLSTSGT